MNKLIVIPGVLLLTGCALRLEGLDFENLAYELKSFEVGKPHFDCNSPLMKERIVLLQGSINFSRSSVICESLVHLNEQNPDEKATLLIHSKGGDAAASLPVVNMIKSIEAPVDTVNIGWCCSAAVPIFQSATGKRYAYKNSIFLLHALKGKPKQLTAKMSKLYTEIIRKKSNLPEEWFPLSDKLIIFDADEALEYKFVDEIIEKIILTGGETAG